MHTLAVYLEEAMENASAVIEHSAWKYSLVYV